MEDKNVNLKTLSEDPEIDKRTGLTGSECLVGWLFLIIIIVVVTIALIALFK